MRGMLATFGNWTQMWNGCGELKNVGEEIDFRVGGSPGHTDEFINSKCSDYNVGASNSIASLWYVLYYEISVLLLFFQIYF